MNRLDSEARQFLFRGTNVNLKLCNPGQFQAIFMKWQALVLLVNKKGEIQKRLTIFQY